MTSYLKTINLFNALTSNHIHSNINEVALICITLVIYLEDSVRVSQDQKGS